MAEQKNGVDWTEVKRPNPHFYKVLVGDYSKSMRIPPKFLKHLQEETETKQSSSNLTPNLTAILEGPTGRTWHVKVEKTVKGLFFTAGWSKFVKDHSLQKHELLIFRYNGCMQFNVLIFDKSACEKEDGFGGENEVGSKLGGVKRKLDLDETVISVDSSENNSNEGDNEEVISKETSTNSKGKNGEASKSNSKYKNGEALKSNSKGKSGEASKSNSKGKKGTKRRKRETTRRPVTEKEKNKAQKAADSFASENPFFVLRMNPRSIIRFPRQFSRKHLPRTRCNFVLRVESGKVWDVGYIPSMDRDSLSKGWSTFTKENVIEEDDFCAFELVKPTEFQVHIFRVVEVSR
ncbi:hypothetical protein LUZ60_000448 [Juncus effusus]|nr:hypothetical protein LUZ60_000448 [Juncus effusus]